MYHLHAGKDVMELADKPTPFGKQKEGAGLRHWAVLKAMVRAGILMTGRQATILFVSANPSEQIHPQR